MQEEATGDRMRKPFSGTGLTGYDNIMKRYTNSRIDNAGTGIMTSTGTPDKTGNVISWTDQSNDPTTGKMAHFRTVSRLPDNDHMMYEICSLRLAHPRA